MNTMVVEEEVVEEQLGIFDGLSEGDQHLLEASGEWVEVEDLILAYSNGEQEYLYQVAQGSVHWKINENDQNHPFNVGDMIGAEALFTNGVSLSTISCEGPTQLWRISHESLWGAINEMDNPSQCWANIACSLVGPMTVGFDAFDVQQEKFLKEGKKSLDLQSKLKEEVRQATAQKSKLQKQISNSQKGSFFIKAILFILSLGLAGSTYYFFEESNKAGSALNLAKDTNTKLSSDIQEVTLSKNKEIEEQSIQLKTLKSSVSKYQAQLRDEKNKALASIEALKVLEDKVKSERAKYSALVTERNELENQLDKYATLVPGKRYAIVAKYQLEGVQLDHPSVSGDKVIIPNGYIFECLFEGDRSTQYFSVSKDIYQQYQKLDKFSEKRPNTWRRVNDKLNRKEWAISYIKTL